ncbi:MAG: HNH endonuclease, partial [Halodesulfurarchaeum sp.]
MGDWRLEKRGEGIYEITFRKQAQERIITSDAAPGASYGDLFEPISTTRVESYQEAEGLFEERAHGPPPLGMSYAEPDSSSARSNSEGIDDDFDLSELSKGGIGLVFLIAGVFSLYMFDSTANESVLLFGVLFLLGGLGIFGYAGYLFRIDGIGAAWEFLSQTEETDTAQDEIKKTPQPSDNLKNELIFGRANQHCEWCGERTDFPEIHHITPRSEGGSNDPKNLRVLCPNCHKKMDAIGRTRQR